MSTSSNLLVIVIGALIGAAVVGITVLASLGHAIPEALTTIGVAGTTGILGILVPRPDEPRPTPPAHLAPAAPVDPAN